MVLVQFLLMWEKRYIRNIPNVEITRLAFYLDEEGMRPIKFRAKMVDGSRWVYGGGVWTFKKGSALFGEDENGNPIVHSINPKTVGQFTGRLDKDEKEIYEGDIVRNLDREKEATYVIRWDINCFNVRRMSWLCEVTGNIYDNPEDAPQ